VWRSSNQVAHCPNVFNISENRLVREERSLKSNKVLIVKSNQVNQGGLIVSGHRIDPHVRKSCEVRFSISKLLLNGNFKYPYILFIITYIWMKAVALSTVSGRYGLDRNLYELWQCFFRPESLLKAGLKGISRKAFVGNLKKATVSHGWPYFEVCCVKSKRWTFYL